MKRQPVSPLPCPWCTKTPRLYAPDGCAQVQCECGAAGPVYMNEETPLAVRKSQAIDDWNNVAIGYR